MQPVHEHFGSRRLGATLALILFQIAACSTPAGTSSQPVRHAPLDPLDERELESVVEILRSEGKLTSDVSIATIALAEPPKTGLIDRIAREASDRVSPAALAESERGRPDAGHPDGGRPDNGRQAGGASDDTVGGDAPARFASTRDIESRVALVVLQDRRAHETFEARVDLTRRQVAEWKSISDAEPMLMSGEVEIATKLVRADERWRRAMQERGVEDFERVFIDVWSPGEASPRDPHGVRLLRALSNLKGAQKNSYGPPIEGVVVTIDMTHERVVEVQDSGTVPLSRTSTDFYDPRVRGQDRAAPASLRLADPLETSITVEGHEIRWQNWRMRWSMHPRDGLVLHEIGYEDHGRVRSILYRASISEMWVPYGDPSEAWAWRNAFDEGEYGLGEMANSLTAGRDVPRNALLFDAASVSSTGEVIARAGIVAAYERDGGLLWSHRDDDAGTEVRRATELVLCFIATAGNYDYGFKWIFHQDGTIAFEMDLTGIMLTKGVEETRCQVCCADPSGDAASRLPQADEAHGTLVADHVVATNHQHFVSLRLDFDIDGTRNRVKESNVRSEAPAADNHGFVVEHTYLRTESEARRDLSPTENRTWEVYNGDSENAIGHATGYSIVPEGNAVPYLGRGTRERALAGFVDHHLWVTRFHEGELYASGDYPSQGGRVGGLPLWSSDDESIEDEDVVVWYTLGVTHVPRPEDYPVMPVERAGVKLVPHGFFDRNPALDVP